MRRPSRQTPADVPFPVRGQPVPVQLEGRTFSLWWGQDHRGDDCLATAAEKLEVAESEPGILEAAARYGWAVTEDEVPEEHGADDDRDAVVIDVDEVRCWLSHAGRAVPTTAALNVWNLATDVAHSLGRSRADRGYWVDRAYDKLFAANVPWAVGLASYRPRWTPEELNALRRVEGRAVGLIRSVLQGT